MRTRTLPGSWQLWRQNLGLLRQYAEQVTILALLPALLIQLGVVVVPGHIIGGLTIYLAGAVWLLVNSPVLYYFEIHAGRGRAPSLSEAYARGIRYFWRCLGYSLVVGVLVCAGLIALIVPGFIVIRRYALGVYYLVDKDLPIGEAMRRSAADSAPVAGYIWGSIGVTLLISIAAGLTGVILPSVPGLAIIVTSLLSMTALFVLPLRYLTVVAGNRQQP